MRIVRNRYGFTPVDVQQQSAAKESIEHFKLEKLEPSTDGLAETKLTQRKADLVLGLFSPALHEVPTYKKYDIRKLQDKFRNLSIIRNRFGESSVNVGLYFNGAVNYFEELPKSEQFGLNDQLYTQYMEDRVGPISNGLQRRLIL